MSTGRSMERKINFVDFSTRFFRQSEQHSFELGNVKPGKKSFDRYYMDEASEEAEIKVRFHRRLDQIWDFRRLHKHTRYRKVNVVIKLRKVNALKSEKRSTEKSSRMMMCLSDTFLSRYQNTKYHHSIPQKGHATRMNTLTTR